MEKLFRLPWYRVIRWRLWIRSTSDCRLSAKFEIGLRIKLETWRKIPFPMNIFCFFDFIRCAPSILCLFNVFLKCWRQSKIFQRVYLNHIKAFLNLYEKKLNSVFFTSSTRTAKSTKCKIRNANLKLLVVEQSLDPSERFGLFSFSIYVNWKIHF